MPTAQRSRWTVQILVAALFWVTVTEKWSAVVVLANSNDFDPYDMNGGLVAAVAGRDYIVLATDTRLSSSYDILERHHVRSRLWAVTSPSSSSTRQRHGMVAPDGSLAVNVQRDLCGNVVAVSSNQEPLRLLQESIGGPGVLPPIWVGSCGCQADCEELKRVVQRDLRAASFFGDVSGYCNGNSVSPDQAAVLLSQILHSRRFFPYYSFCVLAGLHHDCGHVYGYDAVGSYEELAVTCAGQGRDLLQPILDQQFTSVPRVAAVSTTGSTQQRVVGHIPSTVVDCTSPEEAVRILLNAYRSVSEREIGVGDHVMFYTVQKRPAPTDGTRLVSHLYHSKIWTSPLKRH
jgi:20S proteasome subunit beta 6